MSEPATQAVTIGVWKDDLGSQVEAWLEAEGAEGIDVEKAPIGGRPLVPAIPIVIAVAIGAAALVQLIVKIRNNGLPQQIITYHDGKVDIRIIDEVKNGKILIFADKDTVVELSDVPDTFDFTEVAKAAVQLGGQKGKEVAETLGSDAKVAKPQEGITASRVREIANIL